MICQELTQDHLQPLDDHGRFTKFTAHLSVEDGSAWRYLTKDFAEVDVAGSGDIPLFYLEKEREGSAGLLWAKNPGAVKMIVKDGPRAGYVAYYRPVSKGAKG